MSFGVCSVILLQGVQLSEFSKNQPIAAQTVTFDSIPTRFEASPAGIQAWMYSRTNLLCWECSLSALTWPKFIPTSPVQEIIKGVRVDVWKPLGCFCEWTCVAKYITTQPKASQYDMLQSVCIVESLFSGQYRRLILPEGLPKTQLRTHCGESGLTPAEFREKNMAIWNSQITATYKTDQLAKNIYS
jgi:hypothetical protein